MSYKPARRKLTLSQQNPWQRVIKKLLLLRIKDIWPSLKILPCTSLLLWSHESHIPSSTPPLCLFWLHLYGQGPITLSLNDKLMQNESMWNSEHASKFHHTNRENSSNFSKCNILIYNCTGSIINLWLVTTLTLIPNTFICKLFFMI